MLSSRSLVLAGAALAVLAGAAALLFRKAPPPPLVVDATPPPAVEEPVRAPVRGQWESAEVGGTYGGTVVDDGGRPVTDADVLLVGVDTDARVAVVDVDADGNTATTEIPEYGVYKTVARTRTDAAGRFALAAGGARVVALVGYERSYSPALLAHTLREPLKPGGGHVLRLAPAGWLKGEVLDEVTKAPVARADVSITFQTRANQDGPGAEAQHARNAFPLLHDYVMQELGPLVWGVVPRRGDSGFHVPTNAEGRFTFGPVMNEVQIEVVISHPEYMWTEHDGGVYFPEDEARSKDRKPVARVRRPVIAPGQTLEKTYYLRKGREVRGTVVDAEGRPIANVLVALDHVSQYAQHWWYRRESRVAYTDAAGKFRVAGLSYPPYVLAMSHPTFDVEYFHGVKDGSDDVYKVAAGGGWIELSVDGGPEGAPQWSARAVIEHVDLRGDRREEAVVVRDGKAQVERVKPGTYDVFLVSGTKISDVARVDVAPGQVGRGSVRLEPAGSVVLTVRDGAGRVVDPVVAELERAAPEDGSRPATRMASLVSREGTIAGDGLLPGRYVAEVRSPGHVPVRTAPFDVAAGRTTQVEPVVLRRQAYLRITGLVDEDGRAVSVDATLFVAEGGGEWVRKKTLDAGLLPVTPGTVMLKVETTDGRRFERTLPVEDGATVPVEIRVTR